MTLDIQDKAYIDSAIDRAVERSRTVNQKETERYMGSLIELVRDDIKKVMEICSSKPDRDEIREIVQEEVRPIRQEMKIYREEISLLRDDTNRHERDLQRLKFKIV